MTNDELLLAISDLMDKKLEVNSRYLENKITKTLESKMAENSRTLESKITETSKTLEDKITRITLSIENNILPRLQNIESCYTDTYKRYQENNEKMELFFQDINLIKQVLTGHSERLEKLA